MNVILRDMKCGLIISQEYRNRVAKKSFLLLTLLTPILFAALIIVPIKLATLDGDNDKMIAVVDQTGLYGQLFKEDKGDVKFDVIEADGLKVNEFREEKAEDYRAFLVIDGDLSENPTALSIYSEKTVSHDVKANIEKMLSQYVEHVKLESYNVPGIEEMIEKSKTEVRATTYKMGEDGEEEHSDAEVASVIGILMTTLIYMFIFISGSQVMNSVVQEKVNRVVEVMVCSAKPWELMFGKIIAVALVSLTQIAIWIVMTGLLAGVGANLAGVDFQSTANVAMNPQAVQMAELSEGQQFMADMMSINWGLILGMFVLYFIGGYLLYAGMFAAVGAAVDNENDTGQFMMPITIVVLFALYAGIYSAQNPDGPLAFWCSIIPFTSPIVMMVRLPFDVPFWQLGLSLAVLAATVVLMIWLAAKVYRVGILMYGKKPSWKEIIKWITIKN